MYHIENEHSSTSLYWVSPHAQGILYKKHLNNYKMVGSARFLNVYKNWVPDPGEDTSFINFTLKRGKNVHYKYMYIMRKIFE